MKRAKSSGESAAGSRICCRCRIKQNAQATLQPAAAGTMHVSTMPDSVKQRSNGNATTLPITSISWIQCQKMIGEECIAHNISKRSEYRCHLKTGVLKTREGIVSVFTHLFIN